MNSPTLKRLAFGFVAVAAIGLSTISPVYAAKKTTKAKAKSVPTSTVAVAATEPQPKNAPTLKIGTIPDQDPAKLARQFGLVADYFAAKTGKKVEFVPVTDYAAAVTAFRVGDLDLVWFGGLTGVQAQKQVPGAAYLGQRDIDAKFKSVFIANTSARIPPIDTVLKLRFLKGLSFTFGSESSTSGRLMPQYFLDEGGVELQDFKGQPGFSGSHDKTIRLVEAGTFDAGALNKAVWDTAVTRKTVDLDKVRVIYETPTYFDYHWLARPDMDEKFGSGTTASLKTAILKLSPAVPAEAAILELFSAASFIETNRANYGQIEKTAKGLKLLT
jgi:phosphonate transport system substrate-binding protein